MKQSPFRVFFLALTMLFSIAFLCQRPLHNYFNEFSGLVGSNVYSVIQDSEGYLWFTTNKGVSRYDGYEYVSFTTNDGLTDNEVLGAYEDNSSRIWFRTFNGQPCYYEAGVIHNSRTCSFLKNTELSDLIAAIFQDAKGDIWLGSKNEIIRIDPSGTRPLDKQNRRSMFFWEDKEGVKSFPGTDRYFNHTLNVEVKQNLDLDSLPARVPELALKLNTGQLLVAKNTSLYLVSDLGRNYLHLVDLGVGPDTQILTTYEDSRKQIWVGTRYSLYKYPSIDQLNEKPVVYLNNNEVTKITEDHEGSMWVCTTNGVFQFETDRLSTIGNSTEEITALAIHDGILTAGFKSGSIQQFTFDSASQQFQYNKTLHAPAYPREIKYLHNTGIVSTDIGLFLIADTGLQATPIKYSVKGIEYADGAVISGTSYGAYLFATKHITELPKRSNEENTKFFEERVYQILRADSDLFLTTKSKVYQFKSSLTEVPFLDSAAAFKISCMSYSGPDLVVGTETNGLYFFRDHIKVAHYDINDGLASNDIINTFLINNKLHIVTSEGISVLTGQNCEIIPETRCKQFKIREALPLGNRIILGTTSGLTLLNLQLPQEFKIVPLPILTVTSQLSGLTLPQNPELEYNDNNLKFEFKRISYHSVDFNYQYRISGLDEAWNVTSERSVSYKNIPAGDYTFELNYGGSTIKSFPFHIKKPFWKTNLFVSSIIVLFLALTIATYYVLMRRYKRKTQIEFQVRLSIAEAEQKALRAQMNPHFIFNALNAIQNFVLKKDTDKAYDYLGQFAKLIRATLENSRHMTGTLESEISFLKLYLNLERLRFKDQFEYELNVSPTINLEQVIPTMLIQPCVENAIIHGLLPSKKNIVNKITIRFTEDEGFLYFEIEDNGVGLTASKDTAEERPQKKSYGVQITRERLALYDPLKLSIIEIHELKGVDNSVCGTLVKLKIRKNV